MKTSWEYDENKWVNELFKKLTKEAEKSIVPMEKYLE